MTTGMILTCYLKPDKVFEDGGLNKLAVQPKTMAENFENSDVQETDFSNATDFATANHGKVCHMLKPASDGVDGQVYFRQLGKRLSTRRVTLMI